MGHADSAATEDLVFCKLSSYAANLISSDISPGAVHAAKIRIIDTLGALIGGFDGQPCATARRLAAAAPRANGATVLGTRLVVAPEMAAFANATTSRYAEANDVYRWPKATGGHPSDVITPVFATAEHARANGRAFIEGVVIAYEVFCRISDCLDGWGTGVEPTNFSRIGVAAASARLMKLPPDQIAHAISMATISGNVVRQVRAGHLSAWKAVASGEAGRAGVFAAIMAREGMPGLNMPFEGKYAWCEQVSRKPLNIMEMGGPGVPFKVEATLIKQRNICAATIGPALAAETLGQRLRGRTAAIRQVKVEVYDNAKINMGTGAQHWNPESRETADHSIPYVVSAGLLDGIVGFAQFDDVHLADPTLRLLLSKVEVEENTSFSALYKKHPAEHHARITVQMSDGETLIGEAGGAKGDLGNARTDAEISAKFLELTEPRLGAQQARNALEPLWDLENMKSLAGIPPTFVVTPN